MSSPLEHQLQRYKAALTTLKEANTSPSDELVLNLLTSRDAVQALLNENPQVSTDALLKVLELDKYFKSLLTLQVAKKIAYCRINLNPSIEAWWWLIDPQIYEKHWYKNIFNVLTVFCLTSSISLLLDISLRFLTGGTDTLASFAVVIQSLLALLAGKFTLGEFEQKNNKETLVDSKSSRSFSSLVRLAFAVLFLMSLVILRLSLPQISRLYTEWGLASSNDRKQLATAQANYQRAIKLDIDNSQAHYHLETLYEGFKDLANARAEYQIAMQDGVSAAYNNQAHLYILEEKYSKAVPLLIQGLKLVEDTKIEDPKDYKKVRYKLLSNLGWVRLKQKRYSEAYDFLNEAIYLSGNLAPAHCLHAQVLQEEGNTQEAKEFWTNCLKYASSENEDQDVWIGIANQKLSNKND